MSIKIIHKENLSNEIIAKYETIIGNEYYNFIEDDWIYMQIIENNKIYNIIHGFPNGDPSGIVFDEVGIISLLPSKNKTPIDYWYKSCMTDCVCSYYMECTANHQDQIYWYCS
jgi:hypothetical protein